MMKGGTAVLALALLAGSQAVAQTPAPAPSGTDSQIRITALATFRAPVVRYGQPRPGIMECVSFVNDAPRPVKHVRFVFAYDDVDGKTMGGDVLDRYGTFSAGALIEGMMYNQLDITPALGKVRNCGPFGGALDRDDNAVFPPKEGHIAAVRTVRAFVEAVDYADGTAWHAEPAFETLIGKPATAHRGERAAKMDGGLDWTAPGGGPLEITHAHFFTYGFKEMECISFKNVADKPVTSFQVHFAYRAADGSVPEENTQTRTGDFAPGVENTGAVGDRSAVPRFRNCWSYKAPRDQPASATITIPSVTFADGMTVSGTRPAALTIAL